MAIQLRPEERDPRVMVDAIIQLVQGRNNAIGEVTLTPGVTTTTVMFENCSKDSAVLLFQKTQNAAAAVPSTWVPQNWVVQGGFTISHANNAQTDRTFWFLCIGG